MAMKDQTVTWSGNDSVVVRYIAELDETLDRIASRIEGRDPIIVIIDGPGNDCVYFGVGGKESFMSSLELPYMTSVGSVHYDGERDFFFDGHHTQIAFRNLIPAELAKK